MSVTQTVNPAPILPRGTLPMHYDEWDDRSPIWRGLRDEHGRNPVGHGNFDRANAARRAVHAGSTSHDCEAA